MTISRLPSGRYRVRVWSDGREIPAAEILDLPKGTTWRTQREAKSAETKAYELVSVRNAHDITLNEWRERWLNDPLYKRPKQSTMIYNAERTKAFAQKYGSLPLRRIDDQVVAEWIAGGQNISTVPSLRAMMNDAMSARAGRLIDRNPFAGLKLAKTRGNRDIKPPSQDVIWALIAAARKYSGPHFAAWLQVAAFTGMRPGEIDALRWTAVDFDRSRILVAEQFSATSRTFSAPKNGRKRFAPMTPPAREALLSVPRESEFCFVNLQGNHWTPSSRAAHWKAAKAGAGFEGTLYLATRHHAGAYMTDVLGLPAEDVAIALGHEDGGYLVRTLYGHRDKELALDRVIAAYERHENVVRLRSVQEKGA